MTFDKRITFQREIKNGEGSFATTDWQDIGQAWANWQSVFGAELWAAESIQAKKPATVNIRYNTFVALKIDETCRIVYKGVTYKIIDAHDVKEQHIRVEIKVEAVVNG